MLVSFTVGNHLSYAEDQTLDMVASSHKDLPENIIDDPKLKYKLLKSAAIYGANASGKSNLIKAISLMQRLVLTSATSMNVGDKFDHSPFRLDDRYKDEPGVFDIDISIEGVLYNYSFEINQEEVEAEELYYFPKGREALLFERDKIKMNNYDYYFQGYYYKFGDNFTGEKKKIVEYTRHNALFLSTSAQFNNQISLKVYDWFRNNLHIQADYFQDMEMTRSILQNPVIEKIKKDKAFKDKVLMFLNAVDINVVDIQIQETSKIVSEIKKSEFSSITDIIEQLSMGKEPGLLNHFVVFVRKGKDTRGKNKNIEFNLIEESSGTIRFLSYLNNVIEILEKGGVFIIDEIGSSLHPLLTEFIIHLFHNPEINKGNAQLIFTTHDSKLLDTSILRRDQIWFTERKTDGSTELYSLHDFKIRKDLNIEKGYLQGKFNAIPYVADIREPYGKKK